MTIKTKLTLMAGLVLFIGCATQKTFLTSSPDGKDKVFDNLQSTIGGLNHGNRVVRVTHALVEGCYVGAHQLADGQACRVIRSRAHAQSGGKTPSRS